MTKYNEQQLIEVLQNEGLTVTQVDTKHYINKGYVQSGDPLKSLLRTAEQVFEDVSVTGRGKKREYTVGNKREQIAERVDGRENNGGYNLSETGNMLVDIVFQNLKSVVEDEGNEFTKRVWAELLGFPKFDDSAYGKDHKHLVKKVDSAYNVVGADFYKPNDLVREFIHDYNTKSQTFVLQAFTRLEKQGKIDYIVKHKGVKGDGHKDIEEEVYNNFKNMNNELIKQSGYTRPQYNNFFKRMLDFQRLNDEQQTKVDSKEKKALAVFIETYEEMQEKLVEEFDVEYVYEVHVVEIIEEYEATEPMYESVIKTYFDDEFLMRTKRNRYDNYKEHYAESSYFWRAFYYLSATIFLDSVDEEVMESFEVDLQSYITRYDLAYGLYKRHNNFIPFDIEQRIELIKEDRKGLMETRQLIEERKETKVEMIVAKEMDKFYELLDTHYKKEEVVDVNDTEKEMQLKELMGIDANITLEEYVQEQKDLNSYAELFH